MDTRPIDSRRSRSTPGTSGMPARVAVIFVALIASGAAAQAPAPTTFIIRRGADTVATERFTRDNGILSGAIVQLNGLRTEYVMTLRPDNSVEHVDLTRKGRQGNTSTLSVDFGDKSVQATATAGGQSEKFDVTAPSKPTPFLVVSFALSEQIARAANLSAGQSVKWTAVRLGSGDTATVTISRFHADSISIAMEDVGVRMAINAKGDVTGGTHQSLPWIVERKR